MSVVEICVSDVASARAAAEGGADRVELCADFASGGITPSAGLIGEALARAGVPIHVLIRPRAGDFVFDPEEVAVMLRDIETARFLGASGVVVGALAPDGTIDQPILSRLAASARPLSLTFHRAFDLVPDPLAALDGLASLGIDRVLTSGGPGPARDNLPSLRAIVDHADGRIGVMAGGGIAESDLPELVRRTGVGAIHLGSGVTGSGPRSGPFGQAPAPVEAARVRRIVGLVR